MEEIKLWSAGHQKALKELLKYYKSDKVENNTPGWCVLCSSLKTTGNVDCNACYWVLYEQKIKNSYVLTPFFKDGNGPCEQWVEQWCEKVRDKYGKITNNISWLRKCKYYSPYDKLFQEFQQRRIEMLEEAIRFWEDRKKLEV